MTENTYKNTPKSKVKKRESTGSFKFPALRFSFIRDPRFLLALGILLILCSVGLLIAFSSYLFTGPNDQSLVENLGNESIISSGQEVQNWLGISGAYVSYYFIFKWFGISAFVFLPILFLLGGRLVFNRHLLPFGRVLALSLFFVFWISLVLGYVVLNIEGETFLSFLSGGIGYEMAAFMSSILGWGTSLFLIFSLLVFFIFFFNITTMKVLSEEDALEEVSMEDNTKRVENKEVIAVLAEEDDTEEEVPADEDNTGNQWVVKDLSGIKKKDIAFEFDTNFVDGGKQEEEISDIIQEEPREAEGEDDTELDLQIEEGAEEIVLNDKNFNFDPTLDLSSYKYPPVELLKEYEASKVQVTKEELEANKDKIVETLSNYSIGIASIKATIGPTVTLYEIVPEAGVRISKIKNLEDDIALSLSALGIRIIAPVPGKGTIGIEVPNKNKEIVSMRSVLGTEKFLKSDKELPIVFGKTISNEIFIIDLAKMPHILIAGATGQGKSVGLNALLTSLIYKKHPSQLKLVLVDPKKVELSLFNKLERHFLAKLPNSDEPIITDTKKVIHTLNSLCMEMDQRYDLLKDANCRNLKEYNKKFVERRLNPEKGHRFMPYIVLVIDELADLMMTAGKEVETPIARLAQLARAIGIHLVVATQRPSVNVITGIIKANFPARLSFKVTSKIDSRTILDAGGADQLVGQGDMLFSQGSELVRVQCAFVDTPEVEDVCDYIGGQRGYPSAYMLPEYNEDGDGESGDFDFSERDQMFEEAARLIVAHQQGSTSLIQRRLKLGYNRAGRLIDQLEAAGIVGNFEGSKAREVLVKDEYSLEQLLSELNNRKNS